MRFLKDINFVYIFFIWIFIAQCSLFPPEKIKDDGFFVIEKEMSGKFKGIRFYFNRYEQMIEQTKVDRICKETKKHILLCTENFLIHKHYRKKQYCIRYHYQTPYSVLIDYSYDCKQYFSFLGKLWNRNIVRGGGFWIYAFDQEPLSSITFPVSIYYVRGVQNQFYYEEKRYFLFFFMIGKEVTFWQKIP